MDAETFWKIKRLQQLEELNAAQIARTINIDPKTAKFWMAKERFEPGKKHSHSTSILDPYKELIKRLLARHDYTAVQIFRMIAEEGFTGEITVLRRFINKVRPPKNTAYLTLNFAPGEAAQVDFSYCDYISVGDTRRRLYIFSMTLCYSRMVYVEFIMQQDLVHFLQCHRNAFEFFGACPEKIMVDNCKVAVLRNDKYAGVTYNPAYLDFSSHYGFKIVACGVRKPYQKGRVERNFSYIKGNLINGREIGCLESLNNEARNWMDSTANVRIHKTTRKQPVELFKEEKEHMKPLSLHPYDCCRIKNVKANSQFRITFESNKYSVPSEYALAFLRLKIYTQKLLIYNESNALIASHQRSYEKNQDFENPEHIKKILETKARAENQVLVRHFLQIGKISEKYYAKLKDKSLNHIQHIRKILTLSQYYGKEKVERAMEDALCYEAFGSEYIANLLEQRERLTPAASPLHLTRKQDALEIDLDEPDMDIYNIF